MTKKIVPRACNSNIDKKNSPQPQDSRHGWVDRLPANWQPYARLSRLDRPTGWQLLALPAWFGLLFASLEIKTTPPQLFFWLVSFLLGAILLRGAGCTWNDFLDRDLDAQVERTKARPLPSGQVMPGTALLWLFLQLSIGFAIFLLLPWPAKYAALILVPMIALYPLMKRFFIWPQAWLALTFQAAFWVGYLTLQPSFTLPSVLFYAALVAWMIYYDSLYACQDAKDDIDANIHSTALFFSRSLRVFLTATSLLTSLLIPSAVALQIYQTTGHAASSGHGAIILALICCMPFLLHLLWQSRRWWKLVGANPFDGRKTQRYLNLFKSNIIAGTLLLLGLIAIKFVNYSFLSLQMLNSH